MTLLKLAEIEAIKGRLVSDPKMLGKLYKARKSEFDHLAVPHALVEEKIEEGWEVEKILKTKTRLRRPKEFSKKFEDDVWCQLYELGYRNLNYDEQFRLPYGKNPDEAKQIDVVAIDNETVILVECRSSEKTKTSRSLKDEFDGLEKRLSGFRSSITALFGKAMKFKFIYATRNLRIDSEGKDIERLRANRGFYYNDNTYDYFNSLIKNYKSAARYQFLGTVFKGEAISSDYLEVPAVEGEMGTRKYYMFSMEPAILLKMGFILHRTRANESEMPTYQRLLVPSRLKGINKFLSDGGFFPNSIIVNFSDPKNRIRFEAQPRAEAFRARHGVLRIPNAFAIAYIIDGQHRVYGYAETDYLTNNTIPVVAFRNLDSIEQLEIFMSINQNQKAVSASLRGTLEKDLYWDSDRADTRMKALRSAIIIDLAETASGPLFRRIAVGEDGAELSFIPFSKALVSSGILPVAKGNKFDEEGSASSLYDLTNLDHGKAMNATRKSIVRFLNACYGYLEDFECEGKEKLSDLVYSNRGTYAYVGIIGSLNRWLTVDRKKLRRSSSIEERLHVISPYLDKLFTTLGGLSEENIAELRGSYGTGGDTIWLREFQMIIHNSYSEYEPVELIEWKERLDSELQMEGREYSVEIERIIKKNVLEMLFNLFGSDWELEISSIKRKCMDRAEEEREKLYKEGLGNKQISWLEMFSVMDYKTIIEKFWSREDPNTGRAFKDEYSIDIGEGLGSKASAIKWLSRLNSLRNMLAHEGSKDKGLSKEEVGFLAKIHAELLKRSV